MKIDLNKDIKRETNTSLMPSKKYLNELSKKLPNGMKYFSDDKGNVKIVNKEGKSSYNLSVEVPEQIRKELKKTGESKIVLDYCYNSQKSLKVIKRKDGMIDVNGVLIPETDDIKNLYKGITAKDTEIYILPPKFPKFKPVKLKYKKIKRSLSFKRIENDSYYIQSFVAEDNIFLIKLNFNNKAKRLECSYLYNLKNANSAKDLYEALLIISNLNSGEVFIDDIEIKLKGVHIDTKLVNYWFKLSEVEKLLDITFKPNGDSISFDEAFKTELLYRSCKKIEKPIKYNVNLNSTKSKVNEHKDLIGKTIAISFADEIDFVLYEQTIRLNTIKTIYNYRISKVRKYKNVYKTYYEIDESNPPYSTIVGFLSYQELEKYFEKNENVAMSMSIYDEIN